MLAKCLSDCHIRLEIKRRKAVVKYQDLRLSRYGPGYCKTLFLTTGHISTALSNRTVVTMLLLLYEVGCLGNLSCKLDIFIRCIRCTESYIGRNRSREQNSLLRNKTDILSHALHSEVSYILSVYRYRTLRNIIESREELNQCTLTTTGTSYDRRSLSRLGLK